MHVSSRLDRFLLIVDWLDLVPMFIQEAFPNPAFDHTPIILYPNILPSVPLPFKFELMWLELLGFIDKVKGWWEESVVEGSTNFIFAQKLKFLKERIVNWKREEFGGIET